MLRYFVKSENYAVICNSRPNYWEKILKVEITYFTSARPPQVFEKSPKISENPRKCEFCPKIKVQKLLCCATCSSLKIMQSYAILDLIIEKKS